MGDGGVLNHLIELGFENEVVERDSVALGIISSVNVVVTGLGMLGGWISCAVRFVVGVETTFGGSSRLIVVVVGMKVMVSHGVIVAVSSGAIMADSFSSSESGEAFSHFTWKWSTRVNHEVVTDGARFSYQVSALKPDQQCK